MGRRAIILVLMISANACGNCFGLKKVDPAVIAGCENDISKRIGKPAALRITYTASLIGRSSVIATIQLQGAVNEVDDRQVVDDVIKHCYPDHVDETRVEVVATRPRSSR